ncbi:serine protease [Sulfodiicoccus acidiphilus]|uniref:Serine protease n=1 Tax=Sulfodiicoccus acidiphilus TaxID=1670455 RepID=A0A348B404_9CREN|nr:NfeD family protein [Sulfodiicoccus acidiphilus]BBD72906.1 serine protease [Sulfodiicoccus acidiphilus]GGT88107.1 serine protease [Sulfodiicoccus acidiphilus]
MALHAVIPIIIIAVVVGLLIVTGFISDPVVDVPSFVILGFVTYRLVRTLVKTRGINPYKYEGLRGKATEDIKRGTEGYIWLNGELWKAVPDSDIKKGDEVTVVRKEGLTLYVKKVEKENLQN